MCNTEALRRPGQWAERGWARVAFIAHALLPEYLSSALIAKRLKELGKRWWWPGDGEPGFAKWFSFPALPLGKELRPVWVDFYVIPVFAPQFLTACREGVAYGWAETVALAAIDEAETDGVDLTIGWGAMTKVATNHGEIFVRRHQELAYKVSTTHGDAGTAALVLETMRQGGMVNHGLRVAVLGANGAIGDAVARGLSTLKPASICLVGKADRPGEARNYARLERLAAQVRERVPESQRVEVVVHQDSTQACHDHGSHVAIVATTGMDLEPSHVPAGTVVLDMTTPAACRLDKGWEGRIVLTAGCGQFIPAVIPLGFGSIGGDTLMDIGAGGDRVIWGCTGETIARAAAWRHGHLTGQTIPQEELEWSDVHFKFMGFGPQPPLFFNQPLDWDAVRGFVRCADALRNRLFSVGASRLARQ